MNGIQKISESILADARQKADAILAEAKASVEQIQTDGAARAKAAQDAAAAASASRVLDIEEKGRLSAALDAKKLLAAERQALISEAFDKALKALTELPADEYQKLLASLALRAASDGEGGELLLNAKDRAACGEALVADVNARLPKGKAIVLAGDTVDIIGGVVLRRDRIELNCALDVLVRMLSEEAAFEVSDALFGKGV